MRFITKRHGDRFIVKLEGSFQSPAEAAEAIVEAGLAGLTPEGKSIAAVTLGARGGRAARGDKKRRSPEFYKRLSKLGAEGRWGKKKQKKGGANE